MFRKKSMLGTVSLASLGLLLGGVITIVGTVAYVTNNPTVNLIGFFYGIPLLLGGAALKAAELKPVPYLFPTPDPVVQLRNTQQTPTQKQIRQEVTRFRYGTEAHLIEAMERLKLSPDRNAQPLLIGIYEAEKEQKYSLVLRFDSPQVPLTAWQERQEKISRFFGPGITADIQEPSPHQIDVFLTTV